MTHAELVAQGVSPESPMMRMIANMERQSALEHAMVPFEGWEGDAQPTPTRTRKRKPDFVKQVKRAMAAGLSVRSASVTADGVVMTFGEPDAPVDGTVIETAEELRS